MNNNILLYLTNTPDFFLSHRLSLALMARSKGYEVHVATSYNENASKIESYGFKYHEISLRRGSVNPFVEMYSLISIFKVIYAVKPSVLHTISPKCVIYGGICSSLLRVKKVIHAITGLGYVFVDDLSVLRILLRNIVLSLYKFSISSGSIVIFQNQDNLKFFVKNGTIREEQSRLILGSGVDPNVYYYSAEADVASPLVVFPSRLLVDKGVVTFVEASSIINKKHNARMILAGDVDDSNPSSITLEQIDDWTGQGLVEWFGFVDNKPELFGKASIVCLPTYYPEGIPKVLIEAASCGKPIVTTDMPGCNEIVIDGLNGILIPAKSPEALADAVVKLLDNSEMRSLFGKNGRNRVVSQFSSDIVNSATVGLYSGSFLNCVGRS